jgi:hypothetical protein
MTEQQTQQPEQAQEQPPKRPLFRPEAVEAHARARVVTGGQLDLRERRTTWLFRGLLLGIALAVVVAFTVHVDREVTALGGGPVSGETVRFALPSRMDKTVRVGQPMTLRLGDRELPGRVTALAPAEGAVLVTAEVPGAPEGAQGTITVDLGRRSVAEQLMGRA